MSTKRNNPIVTARIYDDDGRTKVPDRILDKLGVGDGDELVYEVTEDGIKLSGQEYF